MSFDLGLAGKVGGENLVSQKDYHRTGKGGVETKIVLERMGALYSKGKKRLGRDRK